MPGLIIDIGLFILIGACVAVGLMIWGAITLARRYGGLIVFVLSPLSLMLIFAEVLAAWGALVISLGFAAMPIAAFIAGAMMRSAHLYSVESLKTKQQEYMPRIHGEPWWKGTESQKYLLWFAAASAMFCFLCMFRSVIASSFLIGGILGFVGGLPFFLYPVISWMMGHWWAKALESNEKNHVDSLDRRARLAVYDAALLGKPEAELRALRKVAMCATAAGKEPEEFFKQEAEALERMRASAPSIRRDAVKLAELHQPSEDLLAGNGELPEDEDLEIVPIARAKNMRHSE